MYTAPDGTRVQVTAFTINALDSTRDRVSPLLIGADGTSDMTAALVLQVT